MRTRFRASMLAVAIASAAAGAVISLSVALPAGQASRPARVGDHPNFGGIWQANNEAHWDLEAHAARPGAVMQPGIYPFEYAQVPAAPVLALGAAGGVPGVDRGGPKGWENPLHSGSPGHQTGECRELDRSRPRTEVLPAGRSARDVHALPL